MTLRELLGWICLLLGGAFALAGLSTPVRPDVPALWIVLLSGGGGGLAVLGSALISYSDGGNQ